MNYFSSSIDAVASIIGTVATVKKEPESIPEINENTMNEAKDEDTSDFKMDLDVSMDMANSETLSAPETQDMSHDDDGVSLKISNNFEIDS